MKHFKVYGEERSATTYLERMLERNTRLKIISNRTKPLDKWKHGFPHWWGPDTLHVFMMRDIYQWLRSVAHVDGGRFNGVDKPFGNVTGGKHHDHWHGWKHPVQCRTAKYRAYLAFAANHRCVILKTEYLKQNPEVIGEFAPCFQFKDITIHTRTGLPGRDDPTRPPLTDAQRAWIDSVKDPKIEGYVDNLTIERHGI